MEKYMKGLTRWLFRDGLRQVLLCTSDTSYDNITDDDHEAERRPQLYRCENFTSNSPLYVTQISWTFSTYRI